MKVKSDFILHSMGSEYVVVAVGERTEEFHGMIRLNESGAFLWECMQNDTTQEMLIGSLIEKYEISEELAREAVTSFVSQLIEADVLER